MKGEILELGRVLGCSARQMQQWEYRGHVPHKWRLPMSREAAKRLVPLSDEDFVWEKPARKRVSRRGRAGKAAAGRRSKGGASVGADQ